METPNRSNFEESWRKAIDGVEVIPDSRVWEGIEARLDNPGRGARQIFLIKFAIAASFLFAMSTAGLYFYQQQYDTNSGISLESPRQDAPKKNNSRIIPEADTFSGSDQEPGKNSFANKPGTIRKKEVRSSLWQDAVQFGESSITQLSEQATGFLEGISGNIFNPEKPGLVDMQSIPVLTLDQPGSTNTSWASMNVAGGGTDISSADGISTYQVADFENLNSSRFVSRTETEVPQSSVIFGVGLGKRLGNRWVLQSGMNYAIRKASGTSNVVTESNSVALDIRSSQNISSTETYNVDHRLAYMSVPLQVGYRVIDSKLNVTILTGVEGEMRVSHKVSDAGGELNSVKLTDDSNFSQYAASALITAEVSYPLGEHYRISAYPQLRQYLTPVHEDGDLPQSLEVGVRLSYIF